MDRDHEKDTRSYDPMEILRERTVESERYRDNRYYHLILYLLMFTKQDIYVSELFVYYVLFACNSLLCDVGDDVDDNTER